MEEKKCGKCGLPLEPQRDRNYFQHKNGIHGKGCGAYDFVPTEEELKEYFSKNRDDHGEDCLFKKQPEDERDPK